MKEELQGIGMLREPAAGAQDPIDLIESQSVLAIHGMGVSDPDRTWGIAGPADAGEGESTRYVNWLSEETMLPEVLPSARIMRYGYDSSWLGPTRNCTRASEIAKKLLETLIDERKDDMKRPLIFLAHSFGGLVVLRALIMAKEQSDKFKNIYDSTVGLVFFGTPFRGAHTSLSQTQILQLADQSLAQSADTTNLHILRPGDESLADLVDQYLNVAKQGPMPRIACWYETKESDVGAIVKQKDRMREVLVNESSGTLDTSPSTTKYARACDHFQINKLRGPQLQDFKTLRRVLRETKDQASMLVKERRPTGASKVEDTENEAFIERGPDIAAEMVLNGFATAIPRLEDPFPGDLDRTERSLILTLRSMEHWNWQWENSQIEAFRNTRNEQNRYAAAMERAKTVHGL